MQEKSQARTHTHTNNAHRLQLQTKPASQHTGPVHRHLSPACQCCPCSPAGSRDLRGVHQTPEHHCHPCRCHCPSTRASAAHHHHHDAPADHAAAGAAAVVAVVAVSAAPGVFLPPLLALLCVQQQWLLCGGLLVRPLGCSWCATGGAPCGGAHACLQSVHAAAERHHTKPKESERERHL